MPPVRRYLRISKHSVLECRIFLENPADGPRWLLHATEPALPRVFDAIKPLVLPKLREENERAKGKGKKKKSVKDIVVGDDFEVSVFLTEVGTKHALIVKDKSFEDKSGAHDNTRETATLVEDESDSERDIADIPAVNGDDEDEMVTLGSRLRSPGAGIDDKKKLGFKTTYEGFAIWGKVLCLLVERKGTAGKKSTSSSDGGAQALMQEWITASQAQQDDDT